MQVYRTGIFEPKIGEVLFPANEPQAQAGGIEIIFPGSPGGQENVTFNDIDANTTRIPIPLTIDGKVQNFYWAHTVTHPHQTADSSIPPVEVVNLLDSSDHILAVFRNKYGLSMSQDKKVKEIGVLEVLQQLSGKEIEDEVMEKLLVTLLALVVRYMLTETDEGPGRKEGRAGKVAKGVGAAAAAFVL